MSERRQLPRVTAVVRLWNADAGWGVLDSPSLPDGCWAHFSVIESPGYAALTAGQHVLVDAEEPGQDGFPFRATRVAPQI